MKTPNGHNKVFHGPVLDHQPHVPNRLPIPRLGTQLTWKVNCGRVHGAQAEAENPENRTCLVIPRAELTKNKMKPTNPNAHTYVNGTDVKTHGYAVTHNTFLQ